MTPKPPKGNGDNHVPGQVPLPGMPGDDTPGSSTPPVPTHGRSGARLPQMDADAVRSRGFNEALMRITTGREAKGAGTGDVRSQLIAAFGHSRRDPTRPDTAAAAKSLGVSQRSVQRWVKAGGGISKSHAKTVSTRARQAMTTRRGRERALRQARAAGTAAGPGGRAPGLVIGGVQGVQSSIADNYRDRDCRVGITDADLRNLQDTWAAHGSEGAAAWLHSHMDQHYTAGWHMSSVDDLSWGSSHNYQNE